MEGKVREKEDLVYSIQLRLYEIRLRLLDEVSVICMYACHVHVMCMSCACHVHMYMYIIVAKRRQTCTHIV